MKSADSQNRSIWLGKAYPQQIGKKMRFRITMMVIMARMRAMAKMRMIMTVLTVLFEKESAARTCSNKQNWHLLGHTVSPLFTCHLQLLHDHRRKRLYGAALRSARLIVSYFDLRQGSLDCQTCLTCLFAPFSLLSRSSCLTLVLCYWYGKWKKLQFK